MRLLLDTQVFLWAVMEDRRLGREGRRLLQDADDIYVSAASLWEIAIKAGIGKIEADAMELASAIDASGFVELPISARHAAGVQSLPRHHGDPFDRLLIAQAIAEPMRLVTADRMLPRYSDLVVLLGD